MRRLFFSVLVLMTIFPVFTPYDDGFCGDKIPAEAKTARYDPKVNAGAGKGAELHQRGKGTWGVVRKNDVLEIAYGTGSSYAQYAALHLDSGYFRMNYGTRSEWGTSVIIVPSFWEKGVHYQATRVDAAWNQEDGDLVISLVARISGLCVEGAIRIHPPARDSISAAVAMNCSGQANLDDRANETFKPLLLSSMYVSEAEWDARYAVAGSLRHGIPVDGWIFPGAAVGASFGLVGGTSPWKENAPTVEITLDRPLIITGWVSETDDHDSDNVGLWAAAGNVLPRWEYTIMVRR